MKGSKIFSVVNKKDAKDGVIGSVFDLAVVRRRFITETVSEIIPKDEISSVDYPQKVYEVFSFHEMIAVSTKNRLYGAGVLICGSYLEDLQERYGDYYIIPVSIHYIIIIPCENIMDLIKKLIKGNNPIIVPEKERLSDNIYLFDGKLKIV